MVQAYVQGDNHKFNELFGLMLSRQLLSNNLNLFPETYTTGVDGRFRITGIGAERIVYSLELSGPGMGKEHFSVMTRPGPGLTAGRRGIPLRSDLKTYGASFDHVVNSARIVAGTVRDKATGKPLAGVQVAAWGPGYVDAFTDKEGKYRLVGVGNVKDLSVSAWPWGPRPNPHPYLNTSITAADKPGLAPLTVDFELVRGVVLRGRLTEKETGKPVSGAMIWYATFQENRHVQDFAFVGNPKFVGREPNFHNAPQLLNTHTTTQADGSFSLIGLPGRGVLGAQVSDGPYVTAPLEEAKKDRDFWSKTVPSIGGEGFQALTLIQVPEKVEEFKADLTMIRGQELKGTILGPDGRPVVGVRVTGLNASEFQSMQPLAAAEFAVTALTAGRPRLLLFYHKEKPLGAVHVARAEDKGPLTIRLEPCGALTGRIVGLDRAPRPKFGVWAHTTDGQFKHTEGRGHELSVRTDQEGRFRLEGLIPGVNYDLYTDGARAVPLSGARSVKVEPGQSKELGDLATRARPNPE